MKVLVCGGRDFADEPFLQETLTSLHSTLGITLLVHGDARGADRMAGLWARSKGICVYEYPARWDLHGKKAGPIRNQAMLDTTAPEIAVAFKGGAGTRDMVRRCLGRVTLITPGGWYWDS